MIPNRRAKGPSVDWVVLGRTNKKVFPQFWGSSTWIPCFWLATKTATAPAIRRFLTFYFVVTKVKSQKNDVWPVLLRFFGGDFLSLLEWTSPKFGNGRYKKPFSDRTEGRWSQLSSRLRRWIGFLAFDRH